MMKTFMEQEAKSAPKLVEKQFVENQKQLTDLAHTLKQNPPPFVMTVGRGSSDHACTFAKYLFETQLGWPTVSATPSVTTLYHSSLQLKHALVIGISQSGQSPDICEVMQSAALAGAITVALVNEVNSPLAQQAQWVIPLRAGKEQAIAATKSFITSLSTLIQMVALITEDRAFKQHLSSLPSLLTQAWEMDWSAAIPLLAPIDHSFILGRGFGLPIAEEAALKLKETCAIQAEALSGAEVLHGPFALIQKNRPYWVFTQQDQTLESLLSLANKIKTLGGQVILTTAEKNNEAQAASTLLLPLPKSSHPIYDAVLNIQAFYKMAAHLALARGLNPDSPLHLHKITETR
ncbi:MAG: SIS domain-containing protein [Gammaproteobacteria bacterium]|nr:SIS domain-containing protein [Gammaproteobacteria bacterium]MBU2545776.1 SIS domain-containing protein [Gammaproteobacteria bacterium]